MPRQQSNHKMTNGANLMANVIVRPTLLTLKQLSLHPKE